MNLSETILKKLFTRKYSGKLEKYEPFIVVGNRNDHNYPFFRVLLAKRALELQTSALNIGLHPRSDIDGILGLTPSKELLNANYNSVNLEDILLLSKEITLESLCLVLETIQRDYLKYENILLNSIKYKITNSEISSKNLLRGFSNL